MQRFFKNEGEGEGFEVALLDTISRTYTFVTSPKLLWDLVSTENQLVNSDLVNSENPNLNSSGKHPVSLGGNHPYYQNILRSLLKRNPHLREVYERLMLDLRAERP